ncbi:MULTISPECIES: hypothetical protein [unclassified Sutcliffiella]|uniref:hypothetical protein n=1 Tax=unclassified Sutcliffiella TaxID=2837532 RepID=UPI0030D1721D
MNFLTESHRFAEIILENDPQFSSDWKQVKNVIKSIYDGDIIRAFNKISKGKDKSISIALNALFRERFIALGWNNQPYIFQAPHLQTDSTWRLDFAKSGTIAIEVAYNHGEAVSWNLIKPVLASNINLMTRQTVTQIGIVITATKDLKKVGGFDGVVGPYEKYVQYLKPMEFQLTAPLNIIGLLPPRTFKIEHYQIPGIRKKLGRVKLIVNFKKNPSGSFSIRNKGGTYKGRIYCYNKY